MVILEEKKSKVKGSCGDRTTALQVNNGTK